MLYILIYFVFISALSVALTIRDKRAIRWRAMRVPESVLLLLALMGGSLSMYITMLIIHHKTRHAKFMFGIPLIMLLHVMLLLFAVWRWNEAQL